MATGAILQPFQTGTLQNRLAKLLHRLRPERQAQPRPLFEFEHAIRNLRRAFKQFRL